MNRDAGAILAAIFLAVTMGIAGWALHSAHQKDLNRNIEFRKCQDKGGIPVMYQGEPKCAQAFL